MSRATRDMDIRKRSGGNLIRKVSYREKKKRSTSQEVVMTKPIFLLRVIMSIFSFSNLRPKKVSLF